MAAERKSKPAPTARDGLISAILLDGKGGGQVGTWKDVTAWQPKDGPLWAHLECGSEKARNWVLGKSGVPPVFAQALLAEETRPRSVTDKEGMLVVLRGINLNPGADPEDMVALRLWVEEQRVITVLRRPLRSPLDVAGKLAEGRGPTTPGALLAALSNQLIDRAADVIGDLMEALDELEDGLSDMENRPLRKELAALRRRMVHLRRHLAPQRDTLVRIATEASGPLSIDERLGLREVADRVTRFVEELDLGRERTTVIHDELVNRLAEQLNQRMYVLAIVAAVFLPMGFVTGLLGINVGGIPGADRPEAFAVVSGVLVGVGVALLGVLKWRRWF